MLVPCKRKWRIGKSYKSVSFKAKPSRKTRVQSKRWNARVRKQPSIGKV